MKGFGNFLNQPQAMMTSVLPSTAKEVLVTVTATDSASPITGEQGPFEDGYSFCFIRDAEGTIV